MYIRTFGIHFEILYLVLQKNKAGIFISVYIPCTFLFIIYLGLLNGVCSHYHILVILIFITLVNTISKLPEDGAQAPKHVGAFVM